MRKYIIILCDVKIICMAIIYYDVCTPYLTSVSVWSTQGNEIVSSHIGDIESNPTANHDSLLILGKPSRYNFGFVIISLVVVMFS